MVIAVGGMASKLGDAIRELLDRPHERIDGNRLGDRRALRVLAVEHAAVGDPGGEVANRYAQTLAEPAELSADRLVAVDRLWESRWVAVGRRPLEQVKLGLYFVSLSRP